MLFAISQKRVLPTLNLIKMGSIKLMADIPTTICCVCATTTENYAMIFSMVANGFHTVHNYIDTNDNGTILRKGAVRANLGEKLIIPMNMRDGSLICIGKGNPDWNYSAPHGAGRLMSRKKAKESLSLEEFADNMKDVYSSSVCNSTLDEAPMAYKPMQSIVGAIQETVDIQNIIRPIYNFKAKE